MAVCSEIVDAVGMPTLAMEGVVSQKLSVRYADHTERMSLLRVRSSLKKTLDEFRKRQLARAKTPPCLRYCAGAD